MGMALKAQDPAPHEPDNASESRGPRLSIVVPAYNEEECLAEVVEDLVAVAREQVGDFEAIIVDDGSLDGTAGVARDLAARFPEVAMLGHAENRGSGLAIRTGAAAARAEFVMYVPADGQFRLAEIRDYLEAAEDADIVIGSRLSRDDYTPFRRLSSRVFLLLVNTLFDQDYKDVNWVHLWRRDVFFKAPPISDGVFMLEELLVRANRGGLKVVEIDSVYQSRRGGRAKGVKALSILKTIYDMCFLKLDLAIRDREMKRERSALNQHS